MGIIRHFWKSQIALLLLAFALHSCGSKTEKVSSNDSAEAQQEPDQKTADIDLDQNTVKRRNPEDFIPKGYVLHTYEGGIFAGGWKEIKGDLNKDGLEDVVLIIKGTDQGKIVDDEHQGRLDRNRRGIIVLFNKGDYYELATKNYACFSSENEDGGIYFAAELSFFIEKGNLHMQYGHGRYGHWEYTFRYQNGDLELIGYDRHSSEGPVPQYEVSFNFLTKKKLTRDNLNKDAEGDDYEVTYKDMWESISVEKLIKLSEIDDFHQLTISFL